MNLMHCHVLSNELSGIESKGLDHYQRFTKRKSLFVSYDELERELILNDKSKKPQNKQFDSRLTDAFYYYYKVAALSEAEHKRLVEGESLKCFLCEEEFLRLSLVQDHLRTCRLRVLT